MAKLNLRRAAYTLDALIDAGVASNVARMLLADGPRAIPERAYISVDGRRRTKEPERFYVWGPDAVTLLENIT